MLTTKNKLLQLIKAGDDYISSVSEEELSRKSQPEKWSKKEMLGHLIDSAIYNLQRFTEIQFMTKPYQIKSYEQNQLVIVNDYQNVNTEELLLFWKTINLRIAAIIALQTNEILAYKIQLENNEIIDLRFLITDYVTHLEHHLQQIIL